MSHPRVRPLFVHPLTAEPREFFAVLREALAHAEGPCRGHVFADGAILRIRHEERKIWSPSLHVSIEPAAGSDPGRAALRGQFSPSSPVWTAFIAIYIALGCVGIAAACYGWAQLTLEETPWALVGVPVALLLAGLTYGAAFIGQGLGAADMYELRSFVERLADGTAGGAVGGVPPT